MKKMFFSAAALVLGMGLATAQTTPVQAAQNAQAEQPVPTDHTVAPGDAGARDMKMEELPLAVQQVLKGGEFEDWEVMAVRALPQNGLGQVMLDGAATATGPAAAKTSAKAGPEIYEIELKENAQQAAALAINKQEEEDQEQLAQQATVELQVAAKSKKVTLRYDAKGRLLSRVDKQQQASLK